MQFDIQTTIQDNVRLKKALQMSKYNNDKLEKQIKQIRNLYQQQLDRNKTLKTEYCQLQNKYKQSYTESIKDSNSLINQIQELKKIIQEKQRDLQQIQIKLIPNLDQDMLRVKIITQMEGPYQQAIDKKDKQISRLKNKITQLQRNLQISQLNLKSKLQYLNKQNKQIKLRFQQENNKLLQQLNMALSKYQTQSIQTTIIKNQKKEIQKLKTTLQFITQNQQKLLDQIKSLKEQRKQLLQKLIIFNSKQALLLEGKHNMNEIQKLKDQKIKFNKQIQSLKLDKQRMNKLNNKLQQEKIKLNNQYQQQLSQLKSKSHFQKSQLNTEIYALKEEIRTLKNFKIQGQSDKQANYTKIQILQKQLYEKTKQIQHLKLQTSRFSMIKTDRKQQQTLCQQCGKSIFDRKYKQPIQQRKQNDRTLINKKKQDIKDQKVIQQLKKQNQKLKNKLAQANQKILQLIKDKMKYAKNISPQKDRTLSNIQKPMGVFLPYQDCGFSPIVEPTLYTYQTKH